MSLESPGGDIDADAFLALESLAAAAPAGAEGVVFHPYLLGERAPLWDPGIRASFTSLQMRHGRQHMARAVLEGVACAMRDCRDALAAGDYGVSSLVATGGGTRSQLWMGIVCDMLETPIKRMRPEGSALGAAMLAGTAAGLFTDIDEALATCVRGGDPVVATGIMAGLGDTAMARYRRRRDTLQAMYRAEADAELAMQVQEDFQSDH